MSPPSIRILILWKACFNFFPFCFVFSSFLFPHYPSFSHSLSLLYVLAACHCRWCLCCCYTLVYIYTPIFVFLVMWLSLCVTQIQANNSFTRGYVRTSKILQRLYIYIYILALIKPSQIIGLYVEFSLIKLKSLSWLLHWPKSFAWQEQESCREYWRRQVRWFTFFEREIHT